MNIQQTQPDLKFKARLINTTKIKKKIPFTPFYRNIKASFVALNQKEDTQALMIYALEHFKSKNNISHEIISHLRNPDEKTPAVFALTLQRKDFQHLDGRKIVGCCDGYVLNGINNDKPIFYLAGIETLSPQNKSALMEEKEIKIFGRKYKYRDEYKNIGKQIVNSLLNLLVKTRIERIELTASKNVKPFYNKLNFTEYLENQFRLKTQQFNEYINRWG